MSNAKPTQTPTAAPKNGKLLAVRARGSKFRRAGITFEGTYQILNTDELGPARTAAIEKEPMLQAVRVTAEQAEELVKDQPMPSLSEHEALQKRCTELEERVRRLEAQLVAAVEKGRAAPPV